MAVPANLALGNPLVTYAVTKINGDTEDLEALRHFKHSVKTYLGEVAHKDALPGFEEYPQRWKHLVKVWVVPNGKANELLDRPDYDTPDMFLDRLIARRSSTSEKYSSKLRNFLVSLAKPASMDHHTKTIREFAGEFFTEFMAEKLLIEFTQDFDTDVVAPLVASGQGWKAHHTGILDTGKAAYLRKAIERTKKQFIILLHRHFMMAMVAADEKLFQNLEASQMPLDASPSDFTDWIQAKILEPSSSKIILTLSENKSPLVASYPTGKSGNGATGGPSPIITVRNTTPVTYNNTHGHTVPTFKKSIGSRGKVGLPPPPQTPNKVQKMVGGSTPNGIAGAQGNKNCKFCKTHFPNSNSFSLHDDAWCYRNPVSGKYDAVKAAYPPSK